MADIVELVKRVVKYSVEGVAVSVAIELVNKSNKKVNRSDRLKNIAVNTSRTAATLALLDIYAPPSASAVRSGAGFGLGSQLVGFPS